MKIPGLPRAKASRRSPDGWLVRISIRLSKRDSERLGAEVEAVRGVLADRVATASRSELDRNLLSRDAYLLVIRPGRRSSDSNDPMPVVRKMLDTLGEPIDSKVGPIFPRLNAAFTQTPCDASDKDARAALVDGLGEAQRAGSGVAIAVDLEGKESRLLTLDTPETEMISSLKRAVDAGHVVMYYQPVVDLHSGRITAFEALMRVVDENSGGLRSPAEFIGVAESSGLIHELGREALRSAASQIKAWRAAFGEEAPQRVAVNVSPQQLASADFVKVAEAEFSEVGLNCLTLELTETALVKKMPQAFTSLESLRSRGAWIALDDFGVEYSNLSYLRDLSVDIVKMDRSFLDGGTQSGRAATILAKIVELAHLLEARVVAEGVANDQQADALAAIGIDYGQGSAYGLPTDGEAASELIAAQAEPPSADKSSGEMPSFDKA